MNNRQSILARTVFCAIVAVLLCGVFAAELPELLSLTDSTSNDFTVRDASSRLTAIHSSTGTGASSTYNLKHAVQEMGAHHTLAPESTTPVSADLEYLHSILRT